jgi:hypothetical protein
VQACVEVDKRQWPCLGVKDFLEGLTPAIRFSCSSRPAARKMNLVERKAGCRMRRRRGAEVRAGIAALSHALRVASRDACIGVALWEAKTGPQPVGGAVG